MTSSNHTHEFVSSFEPFGERSVHFGNYEMVDDLRRQGRGKKATIRVFNPDTGRITNMVYRADSDLYISKRLGISLKNLKEYKSWPAHKKPSNFSYKEKE